MILTEEQVRAAIADAIDRVDAATIGPETDFGDAGMDSLDHAQVLIRVEELYGLRVADEDIALCDSIAAIIAYAQDADPAETAASS